MILYLARPFIIIFLLIKIIENYLNNYIKNINQNINISDINCEQNKNEIMINDIKNIFP